MIWFKSNLDELQGRAQMKTSPVVDIESSFHFKTDTYWSCLTNEPKLNQ